jgi:deoxyribonucleoside regulator
MYYELGLKQEDIAVQLNTSRSQVSRILDKAKKMGLIEIKVKDPINYLKNLEQLLINEFSLRDVIIVDTLTHDSWQKKQALAREGAKYLQNVLKPGDMIGISWGTTLYELCRALPEKKYENLSVVQLKGAITKNSTNAHTFEIAREMAEKLGGKAYYLPVPFMVDSVEIKQALSCEANIHEIIEMGRQCSIAVFSIGYPGKDSVIAHTGYISGEKLEQMRNDGAVGDICSRFFRADGRIYDSELNNRTLSIDLEELGRKEYSIGIAGGASMAQGILGALRGKYLNILITDEDAALEVLRLLDVK